MANDGTILVKTGESVSTRGIGMQEVNVEILSDNVTIFLNQISSILEKSPDRVGKFSLTEITISAEISGQGKLILLGTGIETGVKGGLTFKLKKSA